MTGHLTTGNRHWLLPDDTVAYGCIAKDCQEIAANVVRGPKDEEWPVCPDHWRSLQRSTRGLIETIRTLDRPTCFRPDCDDEAVTIIEHLDGTPLPVCTRHWDDLSWVTPDGPTSTTADDGLGGNRD